MMSFDIVSIFTSIIAGFLSILSPCILPILPIILLGTEKDKKYRPLLIILGFSITFIILGIISGGFGYLLAGKIQFLEKIGASIIIVFGLMMLFNYSIFKKFSFLSKIKFPSVGSFAPLFLGMSLGIIWIPCTGPILSSILLLVASKSSLITSVILLSFYSLGFAIPLLLIAYFSQFFRTKISKILRYPHLIRYISGTILIAFGIYVLVFGMVLL